jgi:hypothetical protein
MTAHKGWSMPPDQLYRLIEEGFLRTLGERVGGAVPIAPLLQDIRAQRTDIETQHASWVEDDTSRFHLRLVALVLASYRTLVTVLPPNDTLALVRLALIEPGRPWVRRGTAAALDHAPDPLALMVEVSKEREASFYGSGFAFERERDDGQAYLLNVHRCFYHNFFTANGIPELTSIFCDWDTNTWAEAIDPTRHGFGFECPSTLALGGDMCRFQFRRRPSTAADPGATPDRGGR